MGIEKEKETEADLKALKEEGLGAEMKKEIDTRENLARTIAGAEKEEILAKRTEDQGKGETLVEITGKKKRKSLGEKKRGTDREVKREKERTIEETDDSPLFSFCNLR